MEVTASYDQLRLAMKMIRRSEKDWKLTSIWSGFAFLTVALVSGCSSSDDTADLICPEIEVVRLAARQVKFDGTGRDLTDVVFEAKLDATGVNCEYDEDAIEVLMLVRIETLLGPSNPARRADLQYFVAVATSEQEVLTRETFDLRVPFEGNRTLVQAEEELAPRIPLQGGESGQDFKIYVGLDLSQEEYDYNRANR